MTFILVAYCFIYWWSDVNYLHR